MSNGVILYISTENVTENVTNQVSDKSVYRLGKRFSGRIAYYILGGCTMKRKLVSLMLVGIYDSSYGCWMWKRRQENADNNAAGTEKTDDSKEAQVVLFTT